MADVLKRLQDLSPERRRLLELRLKMQQEQAAGPELRPRARPDGTAPLSYAQARLWVLDRMDPGSAAYNMPHPLRIRGHLDADALARALAALRARHETLRTTFAEREDGPVQVIHAPSPIPLPLSDLSDLSQIEREAEVRRRVDEDANTGFDLVAGPLMRASLLRLSADEHVLLLCMHHIVSDGWSMGVFARELGALYAAERDGREAHLPPLPVQYADFAAWQREHLRGAELARLTAFWKHALADAPAALELPTDRVRPGAESHRGRTLKTRIAANMAARLREFARAEGATLFNVLTAAVRAVLARHSGQDDVVLGTPVANRQKTELEGLVGFFVNTLPLRSRVSGGDSFRALVHREKTVALAAFNHQDLPFDRIVEELRLPRDPARNPVFQAMVTLQNARMDPVALGGVVITPLAPEYDTTKFDLTLDHYEEDDGAVRMETEWATDLFDEPTVASLVRHVHALLAAVADDPDRAVGDVTLMAEDERRRVLEEWNATEMEIAPLAAHELVAEQARRTPDAVAIASGGEAVTYAELDARASRLAAHLRARGAGAEARVGLCLEPSVDLLVALLATWKTGGAYLPLDPAYPADRLAFMLADSGAALLITASRLLGRLPGFAGETVCLDRDAIEGEPAPEIAISPDSLAYVIYTSGSTGRPKGVLVRHGSLANLLAATRAAFDVREGDVMPALASFAFDIWLFETLLPLTSGATVRIVARERVMDAAALVGDIGDATLLHAVPALMRQIAAAEMEAPRLTHLRRAFVGGDQVPADLLGEMRIAIPAAETHVLYGPTEGTILASTHPVPAAGELAGHPIGRPLGNVRLYVCDARGEPQPAGVPGELLIGGAGVARGYLGRPGLTAETFIPDPFSPTPGARLYRTGDRARWTLGGALEFRGRLDEQAKIRGFRIEPGEVEAALRGVDGVRDCAVIVRTDGEEKRLVAYVVPADGDAPSPAALREALGGRLPDYMVPTAFVAMDAIPLTPNGKTDRRALPAPDAGAHEDFVAPATPAETALAEIWAQVLGVDRVSVESDFFLLGGHSLLATQVVSRIRRALGAEVPLRAVFEAPTVRRLAARVEAMRGTGEAPLPPVVPVDRTGALPLSFEQERLWFLERMEPEAGVYNMPVRIRLRGNLHAEALRRALETVVHRHEALRTLVREEAAGPVQTVAPPQHLDLPLVIAEDEAHARRVMDEEAWRPIDLERGPATRALLVRVADDEHVLALNVHHALADGWSLGIVLREASAAYEAFARGDDPHLPEVPLQYGDFGTWQRTHLTPERIRAMAGWWRERLAGAPPLLELATDRPRPARQSFRGAALPVHIPADVVARVKALASAEGATAFMALLAGFQVLLGRLANQDDVVVGTPVAGRGRAETEGIVGLFVNTLALRTDLSANPTFRALLGQVRETTLGAFAHQELPFEKLVEALNVERSLSHAPVFQVMFELNSQETGSLALPGVAAAYDELEKRAAKFDLTLSLEETADGAMEGALEYATDLFDAATAERIAARYGLLLDSLATEPDARVSAAEMLLPGERERLAAWSDGGAPVPPAPGHALLERWAAETPDVCAVEWETGAWSYAELDRRANRLARRLRALGAGRERIVAIMLERSPDQVLAVLAAWKAGAAYLPIDPGYPAERRAYMLADSGAHVLITRAGMAGGGATGARVETMEAAWAAAEALDDGPLDVEVDPGDLAYVIYTSGSTGRPKGVLVTHMGVANLAYGQCWGRYPAPRVRVLQFASFSFDGAVADYLVSFGNGATLVMCAPEALLPGRPLAETLANRRIEATFLPPSVWSVLPDVELPALGCGVSSGEACSPEIVARWGRGRRFVNAYGPTENTVCVSSEVVGEVAGRLPIGRPIRGVRVHVLDRAGHEAPIGVPGELCVGGIGLARGYHGRPALTAERFIPDAVSEEPGARLYRSGDLCRWTAEGKLEFLGRVDHQVKLRGFRIELGEIEALLADQPGVRETLVLVRRSPAGDERLVSYVTSQNGTAPDPGAMRAALRRSLPEHMVPSEFVVLDAFPLTINGKVDRAALPEPRWGASTASAAPRAGTEEVLAEIWREVLGVARVGRGDGFFALGGHSLLAARTVSRIRNELGVELPLRELFDAQTLEALALKVDAERARAGGVPAAPIERAPRDRPLPLSPAQERLWFLQRLQPEGTAFNMPLLLHLRGELDVDAVARALAEIVRRHEPLRTVFARTPQGPVQVIRPAEAIDLPLVDLSAEADPAKALRALADAEASTPFDLERGPLFRVRLARLSPAHHALVVGMHHVVGDGWSMERLNAELTVLYGAFAAGEPSPLPDLPVQYADFAVWQRGWMQGEWLPRQVEYWKAKLDHAPVLDLPTDRPRRAVASLAGGDVETLLPRGDADRLEAVGHAEGATPFMTFLALYFALLHRWARQDDLVVGTVVAGRTRAELELLIGFFVNTLALRVDAGGDPSFRELLRRVRETTLEAYANQDVPFTRLIEELKVERSLGHHPLAQVHFTLQHEAAAPQPEGLEIEADTEPGDSGAAKVDLTLGVVRPETGPLRVSWEYASDLFDAETIQRQAVRFNLLARAAAEHPDAPISTLLDDAGMPVHRLPVAGDRQESEGDAAPEAIGGTAPRVELEQKVAGAWREVLARDEVGVNDNFFEIGGHSLLLARLQDVLEQTLGREVALVDLFRRPTIRSFAAGLEPAAAQDAAPQPTAAKRGEDRGAARRAAMVRRR